MSKGGIDHLFVASLRKAGVHVVDGTALQQVRASDSPSRPGEHPVTAKAGPRLECVFLAGEADPSNPDRVISGRAGVI